MADHDPSIGPLEPLDPLAPDPEDDVGRLEPIDPEADDLAPTEHAAVTKRSSSATSTRRRDGLDIAVALGILLSLFSMAAIAGLVAISMDTVAPPSDSTVVAPIESAAQLPPIHIGEAARGPERTPRDQGGPAGRASGVSASAPVSYSAPAPQVASDGSETGGGGGGGHGGGVTRSHLSTGGAWCDARPGTACDATVGGQVLQPEESAGSDVTVGAADEGDGSMAADGHPTAPAG